MSGPRDDRDPFDGPPGPKRLTSLEATCFEALSSFQELYGRLPTSAELLARGGARDGRQLHDILHRLVCKDWLESDRLPPAVRRRSV